MINEARTWSDAQRFCASINSNLATVVTPHQLQMIRELNRVYNLVKTWIGLNDQSNKGEYTWVDGSTQCNASCNDLPYWSKGEPNNILTLGDETCVIFQTFIDGQQVEMGSFNDVSCISKLPFYCDAVSDVLIFQMDNTSSTTTSASDTDINKTMQSNHDSQLKLWQRVSMVVGAVILILFMAVILLIMYTKKIRAQHREMRESIKKIRVKYDQIMREQSTKTSTSTEMIVHSHIESSEQNMSTGNSEESSHGQCQAMIDESQNLEDISSLEHEPHENSVQYVV